MDQKYANFFTNIKKTWRIYQHKFSMISSDAAVNVYVELTFFVPS